MWENIRKILYHQLAVNIFVISHNWALPYKKLIAWKCLEVAQVYNFLNPNKTILLLFVEGSCDLSRPGQGRNSHGLKFLMKSKI